MKRHKVASIPIAAAIGAVTGMSAGVLWYYVLGGSSGGSLTDRVLGEGVWMTIFSLLVLWLEYRADRAERRKDERARDNQSLQ
jgi:hypothetical protein